MRRLFQDTAITASVLTSMFIATSCTQAPQEAKPEAKNVILFIGDGMGMSTITAMRIFAGQSLGHSGEEHVLSFETFEDIALIKTYNLDAQVPDSAGTASAMNTGIKTQIGKINVTPDALDAGCTQSAALAPTTLADLAIDAGLSVGIVTNTRLTHATPAAVYGHSSDREFESDVELTPEAINLGCPDMARQLAQAPLSFAVGGGRLAFSSEERDDKRDLMAQWAERSTAHKIATNAEQLRALAQTDAKILGLMSDDHMDFDVERDEAEQPSLAEMTQLAIQSLSARGSGYFLVVEGGRIDHAHHAANAYRALSEGWAFDKAVQAAMDMTDSDQTLILVTADHSHVFTMAGYPQRGNPILGLVKAPGGQEYILDENGNPYTTLGYHNGPHVSRADETLTDNMVQDIDFHQRAAIHLEAETHSGEDVPLYARGPGAHRVRGVMDQTEIFGVMTSALGLNANLEQNANIDKKPQQP